MSQKENVEFAHEALAAWRQGEVDALRPPARRPERAAMIDRVQEGGQR